MRYVANPLAPVDAAAPADGATGVLQGLVTLADLPLAEREWPGLCAFYATLPDDEQPRTFLELVWRFEQCRTPEPRRAA